MNNINLVCICMGADVNTTYSFPTWAYLVGVSAAQSGIPVVLDGILCSSLYHLCNICPPVQHTSFTS